MVNPSDIRVLIAEDEPDLRDLLGAKFRVFGFQVETAVSGRDAWDQLQKDDFQVVVTDVRMPELSGFELLHNCKERDVSSPIVFVISAFSDHTIHEIFHAGAEGFMNKPFDTKRLLDVVRKSLLTPEQRWQAPNSMTPKTELKMNFDSLETGSEDLNFLIGRGGFSVRNLIPNKYLDQLISFDLTLGEKAITGTGIPRWLYPNSLDSAGGWSGIEIVQLTGANLENFKELQNQISDIIPFIPSPKSLL